MIPNALKALLPYLIVIIYRKILLMGVVQVGLQVPTPSFWDMAYSHLQDASPPQIDSPALAGSI